MRTEYVVIAGLAVFLSACSSSLTPEQQAQNLSESLYADDHRRGEEVSRLCFASNIDGFSQATNRAVVVREGAKDYLITTSHRCTDLDHALSLQVNSHSSCLRRGDKLIGRDNVFGHDGLGSQPFPCFVGKIYEWNAEAEAETTEAPT